MSYPKIELTEEVMREGMQIESSEIPVDAKVRLLDALSRTGLRRIAVGSFVSPKYTPQMEHIEEILKRFTPVDGVVYSALALNRRGAERLASFTPPLSESDRPVMTYCHMCDTFARRNVNRARAAEVADWPRVVEEAVAEGAVEAGIGINAAFGSNFEGAFSLSQRMEILEQQHALWARHGVDVTWVMIGDPMGWTAPHWVGEQLEVLRDRWPDITNYWLHVHDSRGLAMASLAEAVRVLDARHTLHTETTLGGVGGCPYNGNGRATGMAPTEDVVNLLEVMGIETGVDLPALLEAGALLEEMIGRATMARVAKAGPHPRDAQLYDPNLPFVETHAQARHFADGPDVAKDGLRPWKEPIPTPAVRA